MNLFGSPNTKNRNALAPGNRVFTFSSKFIAASAFFCGDDMGKIIDLSGQRFGRLVALEATGEPGNCKWSTPTEQNNNRGLFNIKNREFCDG